MGKTKKWKKDQCSANNSMLGFSCYSRNSLEQMKQLWNLKHPDRMILTNNSKEIWSAFKTKFSSSCRRESCWLNKEFLKHNLDRTLLTTTFAPMAPKSWKKDKYKWLNSDDINSVMQQYEQEYRDFEFLGPSPIDYDAKNDFNECVWNELCNFNLKQYIINGTRIIGIIFNLDKHTEKGSHWMALIIDTKKGEIYFFDSYGYRIHPRINKFSKEVIRQSSLIPEIETYKRYSNDIEHQLITDSECGMYCLFIIIESVKGNDIRKLMSKRIADYKVRKLRNIYYN